MFPVFKNVGKKVQSLASFKYIRDYIDKISFPLPPSATLAGVDWIHLTHLQILYFSFSAISF